MPKHTTVVVASRAPGDRKRKGVKYGHIDGMQTETDPELLERMSKYLPFDPTKSIAKDVKNKKLASKLKKNDRKAMIAAEFAAQAEYLLPETSGYLEAEDEMERTYKFTQEDLAKHVDVNTQSRMFDLKLTEFGPYALDYTANGRHLLIGGRSAGGHVAAFDWRRGKLGCELHLRETVRDVCWLHNESLFAVAQRHHVYIYDATTGAEVHRLAKHPNPMRLVFLPKHFLLSSVNEDGWLKYQDVSTGKFVAEFTTKLGKCDAMTHNPGNGVIHLGHANGTVTLWSPNTSIPLVKMLCHRGTVRDLAVDPSGTYMATAGLDGQLKVWDIRKTYEEVHSYYCLKPATSIEISQRGLLAVGFGHDVTVWKNALSTKQQYPYMTHKLPGSQTVHRLKFCPFEDVLAVGHSEGITSLVIPGAGEPNVDASVADPYESRKGRQEREVRALLDKLQPEMIVLNPESVVGKVKTKTQQEMDDEKRSALLARIKEKSDVRYRAKGKSSAMKKWLRKKQKNVIDERKLMVMERLKHEKEERERKKQEALEGRGESAGESAALASFFAASRKRPKIY